VAQHANTRQAKSLLVLDSADDLTSQDSIYSMTFHTELNGRAAAAAAGTLPVCNII
jgi:hypothetical protein